ncbi:Zonadhesin [Manis javanica]|nr:Zonadhesin [Manis javanica]
MMPNLWTVGEMRHWTQTINKTTGRSKHFCQFGGLNWVLCETLQALGAACQAQQLSPPIWRNSSFCWTRKASARSPEARLPVRRAAPGSLATCSVRSSVCTGVSVLQGRLGQLLPRG